MTLKGLLGAALGRQLTHKTTWYLRLMYTGIRDRISSTMPMTTSAMPVPVLLNVSRLCSANPF